MQKICTQKRQNCKNFESIRRRQRALLGPAACRRLKIFFSRRRRLNFSKKSQRRGLGRRRRSLAERVDMKNYRMTNEHL